MSQTASLHDHTFSATSDLPAVAQRILHLLAHPDAMTIATAVATYEACAKILDHLLPSESVKYRPEDLACLEAFEARSLPFQILDGAWLCGPFRDKALGNVYPHWIDSSIRDEDQKVVVSPSIVDLRPQSIQWDDGTTWWVYTNIHMEAAVLPLVRMHMRRRWQISD